MMKPAIAALLFTAACTHDLAVYDRIESVKTARDLDILFVVDTTPDRAHYDQMASQLDELTSRLSGIDGQLPNLHVGVVTTDLGTKGTEDAAPGPFTQGCSGVGLDGHLVPFAAGIEDDFLSDVMLPDGTRRQNFASGDLKAELARMTNPDAATVMATSRCGVSQPLEAMRRALDPETNPGFIRDGAMLAVVFVTNHDDCSLKQAAMLDPNDTSLGPVSLRCTNQGIACDEDLGIPGAKTNCHSRTDSTYMVDVAEYEQFLAGFKADPKDITVSAVAGPRGSIAIAADRSLAPSCTAGGNIAKPAVRIGQLVDKFGGAVVEGCSQVDAYAQVSAPIVSGQRSCFTGVYADDGDDCRVVEIAGDARTELAHCNPAITGACWYTFSDTACGDNVGIAIDRHGTVGAIGARYEATCFVK